MPPTYSAGSASVNIVPDLSGAQAKIGTWFASLKDVEIRVTPNLDQSQAAKMVAQVQAIKPTIKIDIDKANFDKAIIGAIDGLTGLSKVAGTVGAVMGPTMFAGAAGGLVALGAGAAAAAGAVAVLPALFAAAALPVAALTIGVQGVGDAFKALASGDIDKVNEALAKLSPSARDFVTQTYALKPAFDNLKMEVQEQLFNGLGDAMTRLGNSYIPILTQGLGGMAATFNSVAQSVVGVLTESRNLESVRVIIDNVQIAFDNVMKAVAPLVQAFIDIFTVGSTYLPQLGALIGNTATAFSEMVSRAKETGQLAAIIDTAFTALTRLGSIAASVGRTLLGIFQAAVPAGLQLLETVSLLTAQISVFINADTTQSTLTGFFQNIADAVAALAPGILVLVQVFISALLPAFGQLAAALAPLVTVLLQHFAHLLTALTPIIPIVVQAITALFNAAAPLIPVLTTIITAVLPPLASLMTQLAPLIATVAEQFGGALMQAVALLAPVLPQLVAAFIQIMNAIMPLVPIILELAVAAIPPLISAFMAVVPVVVSIVQALAPFVAQILEFIGPLLPALIPLLGVVAIAFGGWPLIIAGIVTVLGFLITEIKATYNESTVLQTIVSAVWGFIQAVIQGAWVVIQAIWSAMQIGMQVLGVAWDLVYATFIKPLWDGMVILIQLAWSLIQIQWKAMELGWQVLAFAWRVIYDTLIKPLWDALVVLIDLAWAVIKVVWNVMVAAFQALAGDWRGVYDTVVGPLWRALQDLISIAWNSVIKPIWEAMQSVWDSVMRGMKSVYDNVIAPMWGAITGAVEGVQTTFNRVVQAVGDKWAELQKLTAVPINFVIGIYNDYLRKGWNEVVGLLGLNSLAIPEIAKIPGYAVGGRLGVEDLANALDVSSGDKKLGGASPGPRSDNVLFWGTAGEYIHSNDTVDHYGLNVMHALKEKTIPANVMNRLATYARGGSLGTMKIENIPRYANSDQIAAAARALGFPNARKTSGFRAGSKGYHGSNQAADMAGPTPSASGNQFMADLEAAWARTYGATTNELIYDGAGNKQADLLGGKPHTYSAATRADHHDHVHIAYIGALNGATGAAGGAGIGGVIQAVLSPLQAALGTISNVKDKFMGFAGKVAEGVQGNGKFRQFLRAIPGKLTDGMWGKISDAVTGAFAALTNGVPGSLPSEPPVPGGNGNTPLNAPMAAVRSAVAAVAKGFGWHVAPPWTSLDWLIQKESSWNPRAANPTSSARGLFQKMTSIHGPVESTVEGQARWGLNYINKTYGSPQKAQEFHTIHNWYDRGGWLPPGVSTVFNGTGRPEPVLTAAQNDSLNRWRHWDDARRGGSRGRGGDNWNVNIHANDRDRASDIMNEMWHRIKVSKRGGVHPQAGAVSSSSIVAMG